MKWMSGSLVLFLLLVTSTQAGEIGVITAPGEAPAVTNAFQKTQLYQLQDFSYTPGLYEEVITNIFRPFLAQSSNTVERQIVSSNLTAWTAERDKVNLGQLKYRNQWRAGDDAADVAVDVRAEQLLAAQNNPAQSDAETTALWKSGPFHVHAPGPAPVAEPTTYCFAGKITRNGRASLSIVFVCMDAHLDELLLNENSGTPRLTRDDSLEIFLDPDHRKSRYFQMIINARGDWWAAEIANHGGGKYEIGAEWNPQVEIKTSVNKQAGRWTCMVTVPFDRMGGVPEKGSSWGVNFVRNYRGQGNMEDDTHLQSWFNVYDQSRNLHIPEQFGQFDW